MKKLKTLAAALLFAGGVYANPVEKFYHIVEGRVVGAFARINLDEKEYVLTVFDHQNSGGKDRLELNVIALRNDGTLESEIMISDSGMDGNADSAFIRSTGENKKRKEFFPSRI